MSGDLLDLMSLGFRVLIFIAIMIVLRFGDRRTEPVRLSPGKWLVLSVIVLVVINLDVILFGSHWRS